MFQSLYFTHKVGVSAYVDLFPIRKQKRTSMSLTNTFAVSAGLVLADRLTRDSLGDVETADEAIPATRRIAATAVAAVASPVLTGLSFVAKLLQPVSVLAPVAPLRLLFAPVCGDVREDHHEQRLGYVESLRQSRHSRGDPVMLRLAHPFGALHAVFTRSAHDRGARRAAILVGGNCQSLEDMEREAKFLLSQGIDVFAAQPSGFPAPGEDYAYKEDEGTLRWVARKSMFTIDERSIMMDASAAMSWLQHLRPSEAGAFCDYQFRESEIMVEGHSLGTLTAHMLARMYPGLRAVVVVEPLESIAKVGTYTALNVIADRLDGWLPRSTLYSILHAPVGRVASAVSGLAFNPGSMVPIDIHGFDARHAVGNFKGNYCAIEAGADELMSLKFDRDATRPGSRNFAKSLVGISKQRKMSRRKTKLITKPDNRHGAGYLSDRGVKAQYVGFLADAGMANLS